MRPERRFEAWLERFGPLVAAAAAVASHATALGGGFVWLDHAHIEDGLALARPRTSRRSSRAASRGPATIVRSSRFRFRSTRRYRRLRRSSTPSRSAGTPPRRPWSWSRPARLGCSSRASLARGPAFAVHPVTSLVASAIAFRSEAMIAVFLLALVVAHVRDRALLAAVALLPGGAHEGDRVAARAVLRRSPRARCAFSRSRGFRRARPSPAAARRRGARVPSRRRLCGSPSRRAVAPSTRACRSTSTSAPGFPPSRRARFRCCCRSTGASATPSQ